MEHLRRASTATALVVLVALLAACGTASDQANVGDSTTTSEQPPAGGSTTGCTLETDLTGCQAVAVTFGAPLDLDAVRGAADQLHGAVLVLWRTDPVCVDTPSFGPGGPTNRVASQFTYWDADTIPARRSNGPPVTDGGYTFALWHRWAQEWQAATQPGVRFSGAVVVVPTGTDQPTTPDIVERQPVAAYRTDDGAVLYLRGHDAALAGILPTVPLGC